MELQTQDDYTINIIDGYEDEVRQLELDLIQKDFIIQDLENRLRKSEQIVNSLKSQNKVLRNIG